ncbi:CvpA family protein [Defluviitalea phaphyphila]|uniref:CvpA family protein n=1 Tax=Defluviitalea phaphyphila TaxID=1473580 RepID=UPI00072FAAEF|nr:CvpA family protein [Defluviitalea phaphyphila]
MNAADIIIILILIINGFIAYKRGFVLSFFKLISSILSIFLAYRIYPVVSSFLRNSTPLFENIKNKIGLTLTIENADNMGTLSGQIETINNLNLPKFLKSALIENNNTEVYKILNVDNLKDYIAGYIANICINIISMILVLIIVTIGLKIIINILDILAKLPIINSVNRLFGFIFGLIMGVLHIWVIFVILFMFHSNPFFNQVFLLISESVIAKFLYEYNLLLKWLLKLFL